MNSVSERPTSVSAIASLVLGVLSLVFTWLYIAAVPGGMIAIALGAKGIRNVDLGLESGRGFAVAGLVLGAVATAGGMLVLINSVDFEA